MNILLESNINLFRKLLKYFEYTKHNVTTINPITSLDADLHLLHSMTKNEIILLEDNLNYSQ